MSIRIYPEHKSRLLRAAALQHTDLTNFVIQSALAAAEDVIAACEQVTLSERDGLRVLQLLENPPEPNAKMQCGAKELAEGASA
jgi:uncharacterized protein (DUF1778 family)